jgi:hypothetical protein
VIDTGAGSKDRQSSPVELGERKRHQIRVAQLEADMAYFEARLELIGEPKTANQLAQRKAFKLLLKTVSSKVSKIKEERPEAG